MSEQDKDCPFCGSKVVRGEDHMGVYVTHRHPSCAVSDPARFHPDVWNRRAVDFAPFKPPFFANGDRVSDGIGVILTTAEIVRLLNAAAGEGKA